MNKFMIRIYPLAVIFIFIFALMAAATPGQPVVPNTPDQLENPSPTQAGINNIDRPADPSDSKSGKEPSLMGPTKVDPLPAIGSFAKLKALLAEAQKNNNQYYAKEKGIRTMAAETAVDQAAGAPAMKSISTVGKAEDAGGDYSRTNTQVAGVDEADVVKTDGKYIYQVNKGRIIIALAYPADKMKIIDSLNFGDKSLSPREIYIDEKHLVVIGDSHYDYLDPNQPAPMEKKKSIRPDSYPPVMNKSSAKILIYDITDKSNITKVREAEIEGNYVSSRKIGSALYLVANKYLDYYRIMEEKAEPAAPAYRDSAGTNEFVHVGYEDIRYFPGHVEPNYLIIGGLNLEKLGQEMQISSYLGSGQNIYASQKNLYVAVTGYETASVKTEKAADDVSQPSILPITPPAPPQTNTEIYRFALKEGSAEYTGKGKVPGTILNQFSMDEHKDYFRIATTTGEVWRNDEYTSKNNIYILNSNLKSSGQIEDIAPGERIYSVRFMGDRAFMVTFKTVDPLFVIDLKNPTAPKILGALKIPGYSDYLHPYDENHIIGFGKDTIELSQKDHLGKDVGTMAYYQGMKIALFDVTDVNNPVEKFKEIIGARGTDSELLHNHKALLFSREKNLLAFPVTVMEIKNNSQNNGSLEYGGFAFQGAYVYNIDLAKGFTLRGKITHLTEDAQFKAGQGWYNSNRNIERILYIGNNLYTLSQGLIKANDFKTLEEKNNLVIPQ